MILLKLIFTLTFYELIVDLDAQTCPKGQRIKVYHGRNERHGCEICPDDNYQPEENYSQYCKPCTRCDDKKGSVVKEECTKVTNRKCQCRGEFVPLESDFSSCKCDIGFGLNNNECSKCDDGYFNTQINSPCKKWRECKSGVKIPGTRTSNVICNSELKPDDTTLPASKKFFSLITRSTSKNPLEGAHTQRMHSTITTAAASAHIRPSRDPPSDTGNYIGMTLLIFGIIGLLVLTAVTCKLHITRQPAVLPKNDSLCRRPVEESGDGSLSSLKLCPGDQ
ncbi:tumor necrosis factor receptor superfamily member 11B isoform X2 [Etheostoma spectabile]|uniref:tumor necrosis factor receptor superfamily member 11B isoform X2 n=1 Tax=Etheostoma spectabile TaxID=54343 RepID=UPI0013AF06D4|nr:tumor necrosis factor receptor superfamily member 11B-like isoform X2 [Etheostoma spectabile]